jgi:hypothetical protein
MSLSTVADYGPSGVMAAPTEWRVSQRREDAERHRELFSELRSRAEAINIDAPANALELEEPMVTTAPVVQTLAPVLCQGDHVSPEDCSWYHGIWQYLRIFNMVDWYALSIEGLFNAFVKAVRAYQAELKTDGDLQRRFEKMFTTYGSMPVWSATMNKASGA